MHSLAGKLDPGTVFPVTIGALVRSCPKKGNSLEPIIWRAAAACCALLLLAPMKVVEADASPRGKHFDHVVIVVMENEGTSQALADPRIAALTKQGAWLSNYHALAHPSLPNYLALVAGTTFGVTRDHVEVPLKATSIVDRLEEKGLTWKSYTRHRTLMVVVWDEGGGNEARTNGVLTILLGDVVKPGRYGSELTHYSVLRTIEDNFGLAPIADGDVHASPLPNSIWRDR